MVKVLPPVNYDSTDPFDTKRNRLYRSNGNEKATVQFRPISLTLAIPVHVFFRLALLFLEIARGLVIDFAHALSNRSSKIAPLSIMCSIT